LFALGITGLRGWADSYSCPDGKKC